LSINQLPVKSLNLEKFVSCKCCQSSNYNAETNNRSL
jgi:hypothetical protein